MRTKTLLLTAISVAGCATVTDISARPDFPRIDPAAFAGRERIYLTALIRTELTRRGRCLGIGRGKHFRTLVWDDTARLGRDAAGWYVEDTTNGTRLRVGDRFRGGGGEGELTPESLRLGTLRPGSVSDECLGPSASINPGFILIGRPPRPSRTPPGP